MADNNVPLHPPDESMETYIARLQQRPERDCVMLIRVTNKLSKSLAFQLEPTGDMAPPLEPDESYEIVGQSYRPDYYVFQIDIEEEGLRVWVEGSGEGQAFYQCTSVAY